jgi:hypothetical protein
MRRTAEHYPDGTLEWAVFGEWGAVSFLVDPEKDKDWQRACVIGLHGHARFTPSGRRGRCDLLPGGHCFADSAREPAGKLWEASAHGKNEDVIFRELESWYERTWRK